MLVLKKSQKKVGMIFIFAVVVLSIVISISFSQYRKKLDDEFNALVLENLKAYTESQKTEVLARIDDARSTLEALALVVSTSEVDPESEWMTNYLQNLSDYQSGYDAYYVPFGDVPRQTGFAMSTEDFDIIERLKTGENVVSNVRFASRLAEGFFFSLAVPVQKNGKVIGAFRSLLPATGLVQTSQNGYLRESISSCIVKDTGDFVRISKAEMMYDPDLGTLFSFLQNQGVASSDIETIRTTMLSHKPYSHMFLQGHNTSFLVMTSLGYNGWYILNYTSAGEVSAHSRQILKNTILISIELILLVLITAGFVFLYIRRQWNAALLDQARYATLSYFSDTVLFEYSFKTDTLEFTSNVRSMLPLENLRVTHVKTLPKESSKLTSDGLVRISEAIRQAPNITGIQHLELQFIGKDGKSIWCECLYQVLRDDKKLPVYIIGKLEDISIQKKQIEELKTKAAMDRLTGLYNKETIEKMIRNMLMTHTHGYLLMVDVDNFKTINDQYGHPIGDAILKYLGNVFKQVFTDACIGRVGGDEFIIYMNLDDTSKVQEQVGRILSETTVFPLDDKCNIHIATSIGIAEYPVDGLSYDQLFVAADFAMYQAKQSGKDTYRFSQQQH